MGGSVRRKFFSTYRNDRVAFVHDCFKWKEGEGPTFYQDDILGLFDTHPRVAAYGPHGLGKTTLHAWTIIHFALTYDDLDFGGWKAISTASAWRQLSKFLWPEVHLWMRRIKWDVVGRQPLKEGLELMSREIKLQTGAANAAASNKPELIEGAHANAIMYNFDEAKMITKEIFDSAEGAFSNAGNAAGNVAFALACSTPGEPSGEFYNICSKKTGYEQWKVRPVTIDETIKAGRNSQAWVDLCRAKWPEESAVFRNRVLGVFAASEESGIIPLHWLEASNERWRDWEKEDNRDYLQAVGVDVAESGKDKTVFAFYYPPAIDKLRRHTKQELMQTTGQVVGAVRGTGAYAVVDVNGLGSGVAGRAKEQGIDVEAFNSSHSSPHRDEGNHFGFRNRRSEAFWYLREQLDPANDPVLAIPPDDELTGELTSIHYAHNSKGQIEVEPKDKIKKRLGRSPDAADAVVMAISRRRRKQKQRNTSSEALPAFGSPRWEPTV